MQHKTLIPRFVLALGASGLLIGLADVAFAQTAAAPRGNAPQAELVAFEQAYQQILERSLRLRVQTFSVDISRQERLQALGQFTPSVSLSAAETRASVPAGSTARSAGLDASINLFRSGADAAGVKAASRSVESSEEKLKTERQAAELEAVQALLNVVLSSKRLDITRQLLKVQEDSMRVARERYEKGLLPIQEVNKVEIEFENARAQVSDAEVSDSEARAKLQALLGHDRVRLEWPWKTVLNQSSPLETAGFEISKRPDFRQAQALLEAAQWSRRRQWALLGPSLDLKTFYGTAKIEESGRRDWSVGLALTLPLYDRYTSWGNLQIQRLQERTAEAQVEAVVRTAPSEVESLRLSFKSARSSALVREKTAKTSERLFDDNLQRFRLGRASVNDLALDQQRLFRSQLLELEGWSSAHVSLVRLCHALGGSVSATSTCQP